ncbi:MAG: hypothetical protein IKK29_02695 [Christensenellaceae bacterium]|nr:hypothetical protein [Christensenellaceae bacterium]
MKDNFPPRPEKNAVYRDPIPPKNNASPEISRFGFSDMLTLLLGMTFSGGLVHNTLFSLLKDIFPYAEPQDKKIIGRMLNLKQFSSSCSQQPHSLPSRPLTSTERLLGTLNALKKYSTKDSIDHFAMLERFIHVQQKIESSNGNLMPLVLEIMGAGSETANMLRMMSQLKNM